jgi:hypothetical protein
MIMLGVFAYVGASLVVGSILGTIMDRAGRR